jgi:RHS repeat-associated protein
LATTLSYNVESDLLEVRGPFGHVLTFEYGQGRITAVRNQGELLVTYAYGGNGNLIAVGYADGTTRSYLYENFSFPHHLTGVIDESASRFSTYEYDSIGRVIKSERGNGVGRVELTYGATTTEVRDALNLLSTYTFTTTATRARRIVQVQRGAISQTYVIPSTDPQQRPTQHTDARGVGTTYTYSADSLQSATEAFGTPLARTVTYQYLNADTDLPTVVTEPGRTTTYTYGTRADWLTKTVTDLTASPSVSRTWTRTFDASGRLITEDGPRTDVSDLTTYSYYTCSTGYECGQLHTVTDALGHTTTYTSYNAHGQPLSLTDANGIVTALTYDARQRLTSRSTGGEATTFEYWPTGLLKKTTLPDGSFLLNTYDPAHRLIRTEDNLGNRIEYTLDAMGNRTADNVYDPTLSLRRTHGRVFNTLNQLWKDVNAAGTAAVTTTYGYDANGNQNAITAPLGRSTTQVFDELNRLKQITDPATGITQLAYDARDHLTQVTDPKGLATSYQRNAFGDVTQLTSPDTGVTQNTYDSGGNVATSTDARGAVATYGHDALNRMTSITYADQTLTFGYDAGTNGKGRLTSSGDAQHSTSWTYDALGRVASKGQTVGAITLAVGYGYANGRPTSLTTPSGQAIAYAYAANGQVASMTVNGATLLSGVLHEPFGPVAGWTWGNGTQAVRTYDTDGKITQVDSGGLRTFAYDDAFRITGITDSTVPANSWTYGYDDLDRLTSGVNATTTRGWTYDANGNRLTESGTAPSTYTYTVSPGSNRVASITGALARTFSYDAAGNSTGYGGATFTYNQRGRLSSATYAGNSATYLYDAAGLRIRRIGPGGTTLYIYDEAGHLLGEYDGAGALIQETVWLGDIPVATLRPKSGGGIDVFYVHTDHLNTPRIVTQPSNNAERWRWDSDPFGTNLPNQNPAGLGTFIYHLRFPGQQYDGLLGLHQNWHRDYDAAMGRYIESDPIGLEGGINTYGYAGSVPISIIDPLGLAYFASRPLAGLPWLGAASQNPIDDFLNTEISHEQLFFEDGKSPSNLGYFDDSKLKTEPNPTGYRRKPGSYDDCIMRKAVVSAEPPKSYCLIGRNCQTWADLVRKEYKRLANDPAVQKECGVCG